ncbi:hypothetical protein Pan241w_26500 [Gimesia alba]|uniref:Uncharacterized protein n=1 Tax=Gimesia alba TaxID=2527973 RepID=A0A517RFE5_9PLAN|nr:hypothetical protein Pan241w_26500 [Gimesia alba]
MLHVIRHASSNCFWCNATKDGAEIQTDTNKIFLCRKHFWDFLKNRENGQKNERATQVKSATKAGNEQQ